MKLAIHEHGSRGPVILRGISAERHADGAAEALAAMLPDREYVLVEYAAEDWDRDYSPWKAEIEDTFAGPGRKRLFDGGGPKLLNELTSAVIPELREKYPESGKLIHAGYSLAGLFALWSVYETDIFDAAACCSGSLWFPGWREYCLNRKPKAESIYLSLGGKEHRTSDPLMAAVSDLYSLQDADLKRMEIRHTYVHEPGGHFSQPDIRTARGIAWCVQQCGR